MSMQWKMVPVEATAKMMRAGDDSGDSSYTGTWMLTPDKCYAAMLSAAPEFELSEEDVERAWNAYDKSWTHNGETHRTALRAAILAALGVAPPADERSGQPRVK